MEQLKAIFERKPEYFKTVPVEVEHVIRISGEELDALFQKPYLEYDFIKEHIEDMFVDEKNVYHAILVMSDERVDGLLIESEGADYARYASYVPCTAIAASPFLSELVTTLDAAASYIVTAGRELPENNTFESDLSLLDDNGALCLQHNVFLQESLVAMLLERDDVANAEIRDGILSVKFEPEAEMLPQLGR